MPKKINICLLGAPKSGKTELLKKITSGKEQMHHFTTEAEYKPSKTIGVYLYDHPFNFVIRLWDFCGNDRYLPILGMYTKPADVFMVTFDLTQDTATEHCEFWIEKAEEAIKNKSRDIKKIPIIFVGTKSDHIDACDENKKLKRESELKALVDKYKKEGYEVSYVITSAKDELKGTLASKLFSKEIISPLLESKPDINAHGAEQSAQEKKLGKNIPALEQQKKDLLKKMAALEQYADKLTKENPFKSQQPVLPSNQDQVGDPVFESQMDRSSNTLEEQKAFAIKSLLDNLQNQMSDKNNQWDPDTLNLNLTTAIKQFREKNGELLHQHRDPKWKRLLAEVLKGIGTLGIPNFKKIPQRKSQGLSFFRKLDEFKTRSEKLVNEVERSVQKLGQ